MPTLREFDLTDPTAVLVAADAIQEQGREAEAAVLRSGKFAIAVDRETVISTDTEPVERELARLDVNCTHTRPEGIAVYLDPSLPAGWVRLSDGTGTVYGAIPDIAERLSGLHEDSDWDAVWDALPAATTMAEIEWPEDLECGDYSETDSDVADINENPNIIRVLACNDGERYIAGPDGVTENVFSWFQYMNEAAKTREEAIRIGWTE